MKIKSMFYSLLLCTAAFVFFTSCTGNKKEDQHASDDEHAEKDTAQHASGSTATEEASDPQFQVDTNFQSQLASVFTSYVELKDAFVASDADKVKKETDEALAKVDMKLVSGAAHNDWMNYRSPIQSSLKEIQGSTDIEERRKAFSTLSDNLYKSVKAFGLGGNEAFYEYCSMAFNNEGAYWLSDQPQIKNPLSPGQSVKTRTIDIAQTIRGEGGHNGMGRHAINGKIFKMERVDETVSAGTTEVWEFDNSSGDMIPKYRSGYTLGDQVLYAGSTDPKNDVYVITGMIEEADAPFDYLITRLPLTAPPNEIPTKSEQLSLNKKGKTE